MGRKRDRDASGRLDDAKAGKPSKKRRHLSEKDIKFVKLYDDLANELEDVRNAATKSLLLELDPKSGKDSEAIEKCFTRLTRGINSNRKAARLGFSVALTQLLGQTYIDNPQSSALPIARAGIVEFVIKQTTPQGDFSNQVKPKSLTECIERRC